MAIPAKILSYIANMNKLLFACPKCWAQNSVILKEGGKEEFHHKCQHCRQEYDIDIRVLELNKEK